MRLSRRQLRALRRIEDELAASDPGLNAFYVSFTARAGNRETPPELPGADRAAPWPARMLASLWPGRNVTGQADDRRAEHRNEP